MTNETKNTNSRGTRAHIHVSIATKHNSARLRSVAELYAIRRLIIKTFGRSLRFSVTFVEPERHPAQAVT